MGTNDGGRTVHNECRILDYYTSKAARKLGLRAHTVGGKLAWDRRKDPRTGERKKRKINVGGQMLHAAADVEGHEGADSRMYLLDLARAFPPEDPNATLHLSGMLRYRCRGLAFVTVTFILRVVPVSQYVFRAVGARQSRS